MSYRLLDSGFGRKLEEIGPYRIDRQAPQAVWRPLLAETEWKKAIGRHVRSEKGGGHWQWRAEVPESWACEYGGLSLFLKPTPFGHLGLFAEQAEQWEWLRGAARAAETRQGHAAKILNLFAYTGGASLAAAQGGAQVTHVDAAKGIVDWAQKNGARNRLTTVRWIVDDCLAFCRREVKRGNRYDGVILDPPSFGRGAKGEVWTIERDLPPLLDEIALLVGKSPALLLFSCHSAGYTPLALPNLLGQFFDLAGLEHQEGEMSIPEEGSARRLPSGFFLRASWRR